MRWSPRTPIASRRRGRCPSSASLPGPSPTTRSCGPEAPPTTAVPWRAGPRCAGRSSTSCPSSSPRSSPRSRCSTSAPETQLGPRPLHARPSRETRDGRARARGETAPRQQPLRLTARPSTVVGHAPRRRALTLRARPVVIAPAGHRGRGRSELDLEPVVPDLDAAAEHRVTLGRALEQHRVCVVDVDEDRPRAVEPCECLQRPSGA